MSSGFSGATEEPGVGVSSQLQQGHRRVCGWDKATNFSGTLEGGRAGVSPLPAAGPHQAQGWHEIIAFSKVLGEYLGGASQPAPAR